MSPVLFNSKNIQLIIGLGNPTAAYARTYHNVGMLALAYIQKNIPQNWDISGDDQKPKKSFLYRVAYAPDGHRVLLAQSRLFMNESGIATRDILSFFNIPLDRLLVVHDDSDQTIGSYKITFDQRSGGHKGVESIIAINGSQKFWRGKIGVRPSQEAARKKADEFVLKKISKKDMNVLEEEVFPKIVLNIFD